MKENFTKQRLTSGDIPTLVPANVLSLDLSHAVNTHHGSKFSVSDMPPLAELLKSGRFSRKVEPSATPRAVSMPASLKALPAVPMADTHRVRSPDYEQEDTAFQHIRGSQNTGRTNMNRQTAHRPQASPQVPHLGAFSSTNVCGSALAAVSSSSETDSSREVDSQFSINSESSASSMSGTSLRILQFVDTYVSESLESFISRYERIIDPDVYTLSGVSASDSLFSDEQLQEKGLPELPPPQLTVQKRQQRLRLPRRAPNHGPEKMDGQSMVSGQSRTSQLTNAYLESKAEIRADVLRKPFSYCLDSPRSYDNSRFPSAKLLPKGTGLQRPPIQPRCVTAAPDLQHSEFVASPKPAQCKPPMLLVSASRYLEPWKRVLSSKLTPDISKKLPATPDERHNRFAYV